MSQQHFLQSLLKRRDVSSAALEGGAAFRLRNLRSGVDIATTLETAFSSAARNRGLLGRDGLPPGHALIIAPTNLVHTFAMRFAIDILFVAKSGLVLKVRRAVPPRRITGAWGGFAVVELAAGGLDASGTRAGDSIEVAGS